MAEFRATNSGTHFLGGREGAFLPSFMGPLLGSEAKIKSPLLSESPSGSRSEIQKTMIC